MIRVRRCMNTRPVTIRPETDLRDALEVMSAMGARHLPVVTVEQRFVGVVIDHELRAALVRSNGHQPQEDILSLTELGTPTVDGDTSVEDAWELLCRYPEFNPLPVVTDGVLEGTVWQHDLFRVLSALKTVMQAGGRKPRHCCEDTPSPMSPMFPSRPRSNGVHGMGQPSSSKDRDCTKSRDRDCTKDPTFCDHPEIPFL